VVAAAGKIPSFYTHQRSHLFDEDDKPQSPAAEYGFSQFPYQGCQPAAMPNHGVGVDSISIKYLLDQGFQ
jgi:hypothetical protein